MYSVTTDCGMDVLVTMPDKASAEAFARRYAGRNREVYVEVRVGGVMFARWINGEVA